MYCNRLIDNNDVENEIMNIIRHSLHAIEYLGNNKKSYGEGE